MGTIVLEGLVGAHPLGALAAFGLLRCCEELDGFRGARLRWKQEVEWCAVLETTDSARAEELIEALSGRQKNRAERPELNWAVEIKTAVGRYVEAAHSAQQHLLEGRREYADFLAAFACELCTDDAGRVEPTAFSMTSGRQKFLDKSLDLAKQLAAGVRIGRRRKATEGLFREALFGPWKYEDPQHSLGWDPSTERLHALRARSPEGEESVGVTAAVWLAFEALPLFPCFLSGGRLVTTGYSTHEVGDRRSVTHLTWPLWESPIPLGTLRSLLSLPELAAETPRMQDLRARGIAALFRSERYKVKTQGNYFILRPAYPCR